MRRVVNMPLASANELAFFSDECVVVPDIPRVSLPPHVCTHCFPEWIPLHELGLRYCGIWGGVVEAVANANFTRAASLRSELEPVSAEFEKLLDEVLKNA